MKKLIVCFAAVLIWSVTAFAANDAHEEERVKDAGEVLKEILNIPDDIPQDLLDKAECVVVLPSVKKGAFGIGGRSFAGRDEIDVARRPGDWAQSQHHAGRGGNPIRAGWGAVTRLLAHHRPRRRLSAMAFARSGDLQARPRSGFEPTDAGGKRWHVVRSMRQHMRVTRCEADIRGSDHDSRRASQSTLGTRAAGCRSIIDVIRRR